MEAAGQRKSLHAPPLPPPLRTPAAPPRVLRQQARMAWSSKPAPLPQPPIPRAPSLRCHAQCSVGQALPPCFSAAYMPSMCAWYRFCSGARFSLNVGVMRSFSTVNSSAVRCTACGDGQAPHGLVAGRVCVSHGGEAGALRRPGAAVAMGWRPVRQLLLLPPAHRGEGRMMHGRMMDDR